MSFLVKNWLEDRTLRLFIVTFWTIFWFLNVVDKFIGGPIFLWVGKDRLAQFTKFFASLGVEHPGMAIAALVVGTLLEIAAFTFMAGASFNLFAKREQRARDLFTWGSLAGLALFTFFAIGDQIFGDRFELLEHTLFWVAILISWAAYVWLAGKSERRDGALPCGRFCREYIAIVAIAVVLGAASILTVVPSSLREYREMHEIVQPEYIGGGVYKFELTFLQRGYVWENTLKRFVEENPQLRILSIQNSPPELRSKADNVIIFVMTEKREIAQFR